MSNPSKTTTKKWHEGFECPRRLLKFYHLGTEGHGDFICQKQKMGSLILWGEGLISGTLWGSDRKQVFVGFWSRDLNLSVFILDIVLHLMGDNLIDTHHLDLGNWAILQD